jgi:hypothetical protein
MAGEFPIKILGLRSMISYLNDDPKSEANQIAFVRMRKELSHFLNAVYFFAEEGHIHVIAQFPVMMKFFS